MKKENRMDTFTEMEEKVRRYCGMQTQVSLFTLMVENALSYADLEKIVVTFLEDGTFVKGTGEDEYVVVPERDRVSLREKMRRRMEGIINKLAPGEVRGWLDNMRWRSRNELEEYCNEEEDVMPEHGGVLLAEGVFCKTNGGYAFTLSEEEYSVFRDELRKRREELTKESEKNERRGSLPFRGIRVADDEEDRKKREEMRDSLDQLMEELLKKDDESKAEEETKPEDAASDPDDDDFDVFDLFDEMDDFIASDTETDDFPVDTVSPKEGRKDASDAPCGGALNGIRKTFEKADGKGKMGKNDPEEEEPDIAEELRIMAIRTKIIDELKDYVKGQNSKEIAVMNEESCRISIQCNFEETLIMVTGTVTEKGTLVLCDDGIRYEVMERVASFGKRKKLYKLMEENDVFPAWQFIQDRTFCVKTIKKDYVEETKKYIAVIKYLSKLASGE